MGKMIPLLLAKHSRTYKEGEWDSEDPVLAATDLWGSPYSLWLEPGLNGQAWKSIWPNDGDRQGS